MKYASLLLALLLPAFLTAQETPVQIPLWPNGAPGSESRRTEPEQAQDWWVKNVHNPSITVFLPPKEKATGTAVVICPGGGHRALVYNSEGRDAAQYLNSLGVAAFVLKYRLFREENSTYTFETTRQDAYRAMRLIRSRAAEWGVDADRIGIMGFSAGGEVVAQVAYTPGTGDPNAPDPIDRLPGLPNFQVLVYPGTLGVPAGALPTTAPPAFLVAAIDDECCASPVVTLLQKYFAAKIPAEAHVYAKGGHAFNMGKRTSLVTLKSWPQRMADWLSDNGWLTPKASGKVGLFEKNGDVGAVLHRGKTEYDSVRQTYQLSGSGSDIWFKKDEFHYAYQPVKGNVILQANGKFIGTGVDPNRKCGWMVRSSLDTSAAMVCATVHGDGHTAIQYRKHAGMNIEEVKSPVKMPDVIQLERRGSSWLLSVAKSGEPFWTVEVPDFDFPQELYAGLYVCSHNKEVVESAEFTNVRIITPAKADFMPYRDYIGSRIEVMDVFNGERKVLFSAPNSLQAPNWTPDNKSLIYNADGLMYRFDFASGKPVLINTDFVKQNNSDHALSFDGQMIGLSSPSGDTKSESLIYTVPVGGGVPKPITPTGPSYLHGWSPDGKWLTYTAQRNNEFDIYKIPSKGGKEIRLTDAPGLDDGPEFSPDGNYIYFNSARSGTMQLWRMKPDGKTPEQLTFDGYNNWFPHVSPDGKWIVFLSYQPDVPADDHPFYKHTYLRMIPASGGQPKVIGYLYGGQGAINTASWSPDSRKIAFVSN